MYGHRTELQTDPARTPTPRGTSRLIQRVSPTGRRTTTLDLSDQLDGGAKRPGQPAGRELQRVKCRYQPDQLARRPRRAGAPGPKSLRADCLRRSPIGSESRPLDRLPIGRWAVNVRAHECPGAVAASSFGRESIPLSKPRESTAIPEVPRGGELEPEPAELQVLLSAPSDFAHHSGR